MSTLHQQPSSQSQPLSDALSRYVKVRAATLALAAPLSAEDCQLQSMPDASPTKWHLAHTSWFFETFILERFEPNFKAHDAQYRVLFNSYYNAVGEKHPRPQRGLISKPTLEEVYAYRAAVDERMQALLSRARDAQALAALHELLEIGLHHEQQHQELILTDIKHAFSRNPAQPAYAKGWPLSRVHAQPQAWLSFEGGVHEIGHQGAGFCFDNETPRHKTYLRPYALASRLVTHGEWLAFMADGGYKRPELWLSLGWDWVQQQRAEAPLYWSKRSDSTQGDDDWYTFTLRGAVQIDPCTPVCHINYFEADAYARWLSHSSPSRLAGARLPTEAEWEHAAEALDFSSALKESNLAEQGIYHPMPTATPHTGELQQMFGDVWEWTSSSYAPYPGYKAWVGAVGEYNGKFMCNQYVLRGGSCLTPASHIRASYRNFFPPDAQWQFSGLRLAKDI